MNATAHWNALPHGPLLAHEENLWSVEGQLPNMKLGRRMTVARTAGGRLIVHSAVALDDAGMAAVDALGPVGWLVVPNGFHRMDAPRFKQRYPGAVVLCPRGATKRVAQRVPVDGSYEDAAAPRDASVRLLHLAGTADREGVLEVRSKGGTTLVFNDCLFNQPHMPGLDGWFLRVLGSTGTPRVTFIARTALVKDKARLREHLEELAGTPGLARLVPGHGAIIEDDPAGVLRAVASKL